MRRTAPARRLAAAATLLLVAACASSPAPAPAPFAAPGPVVAEDVQALPILAELAAAPDGRTAVYALLVPDAEADGFASELWAIDLENGGTRRLTPAGVGGRQPSFSADGRELFFVEENDAGDTLRAQPWPRGRARAVATFEDGLEDYAAAPDGRSFVVVLADPAPTGATEHSPRRITRSLSQIDGQGLTDDRRTHLWRVARGGGAPVRLTSGPFDDDSPAISPDGEWVAFASNRHPDPDATDDTDLYLVRADGTGLRALATGPGPDTTPVWSHRGDRIAYLSVRRANDFYQPIRVATIALDGGAPVDLTGALDNWVANDSLAAGTGPAAPIWSRDDAAIDVPFERRGATWLARISSTAPADARELAGGREAYGLFRPLPDGGFLATATTPTAPPELYRFAPDGSRRKLTDLYGGWLAGRRLVAPEKLTARNPDGDEVEAWLYPPLDRAPGRRYPLILYIHGGPQGYDGDFFDFDLENQLFPARGWAVLRVNYRGSTAYGEAFSRAIWGDWHRREYDDLMAALDAAIASHDWIDPARLGIGGWSYGGIMTLWTVGHTDRFRVGVPERFSFDYLSAFGEDQWFTWYLSELGSPFENAATYRRLSPGTYLQDVKTPLYLIANEDDRNCPLPQVLQAYQRLKLMGQQTELVVYPGESHGMARLSNLVDRLRRLTDWFGRHLGE